MPNKEMPTPRAGVEVKQPIIATQPAAVVKPPNVTPKVVTTKVVKDSAMSPTGNSDTERTELLGSLTTQQQQRTSARVIKKLKLEPPPDKRAKRDGETDILTECDTPNKLEQELKFPTVKQRMPKALWSTDEKNLFFEALNEYGKDFDAITTYICAKAKKKGIPDVNLKTKTQVSHFYYRTWHKLSKHVHFDENVKKVAQELYALINYGELRKKLVSVSEKTCARLSEMVRCGSLVVRVRGRNVRVRTPMCRALRRLNQIHERSCGPLVVTRCLVVVRARSAAAWSRVQAAAHNPRLHLAAPLRTTLRDLLAALQRRWKVDSWRQYPEEPHAEEDYLQIDDEDEDHLGLVTDRLITREHHLPRKLALHVGPRPDATINLPVLTPSEQLSSQKICFSSYLQRMCSIRHKDASAKMRTPKRQRKDSATDKEKELEQKKMRLEDDIKDDPTKLMQIDETAVDGIDLMASFRNIQDEEEKPSTEDEKELKSEETAEEDLERDGYKEMSEREKDSFSEMEDDEKYNKSDTDNESDHGKKRDGEYKNLKVKFRIRPKERGGSEYTLVSVGDKDDDVKMDDPVKDDHHHDELKSDELKSDDLKSDDVKVDETKGEDKTEESKVDVDVETAIKQIRSGWSVHDAGDLTIGDLYLMFGARARLELQYWWAAPRAPLPATPHNTRADCTDRKADKPIDKGDSSVEETEKRESDTDIFSPKTFAQDSNDGLSGDERKSEQLASPEHKSSNASLKLVSKLINRPQPPTPTPNSGLAMVGDRLRRLLALVGNPHVTACSIARCECGHVCTPQRKQVVQKQPLSKLEDPTSLLFRHPTPIAPRPDSEVPATNTSPTNAPALNLEGLPRWRRGRPRGSTRRVVVQRLLPLMPKLQPTSNLIPVKIVPNSPPVPPKILPKPPPTTNSDAFFYVLSDSNGQYYFHDGDRRVPITPLADGLEQHVEEDQLETKDEIDVSDTKVDVLTTTTTICLQEVCSTDEKETDGVKPAAGVTKTDNATASDIAQFLPSESMSLSPSRLLRDADCWPEGSVQDFSLSSFLGHLEARQPELQVDSQLQSLMAESSVDYVAKFADLAAEVTETPADRLTDEDLK